MLSLKKKDLTLRSKFNQLEKIQGLNKVLNINLSFRNFLMKKSTRAFAISNFSHIKVLVSKVKMNRRCILTNRSRSVVRRYNISQSMFQKISKQGWVPGCKKASW